MKLPISIKFGLIAFLLASIGIFSVAYLSFKSSSEALKTDAVHDTSNDLLRESQLLHSKLNTMKEDVMILSEVPQLAGMMRAAKHGGYDPDENTTGKALKKQLEKIFKNLLENRQVYQKIRFIGVADKGREIVRVELQKRKAVARSGTILQQKWGRYYLPATVKLKKGEVYFSEIDLNREYGKIDTPHILTLRASTPIYDSSTGKVFGIIIINANFSKIAEGFNKKREEGYYFIANNHGEYLIHPDKKKQYQFEFGGSYKIEDDYLIKPKGIDNLHRVGEYKFLDIPKKKMGVLFQHIHMGGSDKNAYIILAAVTKYATLYASSQKAQKRIIIIAAAVSLVIAMLAGFGAFILTRSIGVLKNAVDRIADGEKEVAIPYVGSDEIGSFADSMRGMLDRVGKSEAGLRELARSLEQKVDERTKKLVAQETEQRATLNAAPNVIIRINADGTILSANNATLQILGYGEKDLEGCDVTKIFPAGLEELKAELYASGLDLWGGEKTLSSIEAEAVKKNGGNIPVEYSISEYFIEERHNYIVIIRDITERKLAETILAKSEEKYKALVENSDIVAWEYDWSEQRFTYVSENVFQKFGYTIEAWCEKGFWAEHIFNKDKEYAVEFCTCASEKGEDHDFEYRLIHADGRATWVRDIISVEMKDGKPAMLRGFLLDVDERKKKEQELQKTHEELVSKNKSLEEFQRVTVGRELAMVKLKQEINNLLEKSGEAIKYEEVNKILSGEKS